MPQQTILVLGCGIAGVACARALQSLLPGERIVVIDRETKASYPPSLAALGVSEVRGSSIQRARGRLARRGLEFINATVQHIDVEGRQVRAESRELRFDYLVLAMGREPAFERLPGLSELSQAFHSFEAAERLAATLRYFAGGRVLISAASGASKWSPAPYEMAMLLEHHFHMRKMRQKVDLSIVASDALPLQALGAEVSGLVAGQLAHKGIEYAGGRAVVALEPGRHLARLDDGSERAFDLLVTIPPLAPPQALVEAGLVDESGRVTVDPATYQTPFDSIFALGDCARPASGEGDAVGSAALAAQQARAVARQIATRIKGGASPGPVNGKARWFVEVGAGAAAMISGDFLRDRDGLRISQPSIVWHWAKAAMEKRWLYGMW